MFLDNFMYSDVSLIGNNLYISGYNLITKQKEIIKTKEILNLELGFRVKDDNDCEKVSYPNNDPLKLMKFDNIYEYRNTIKDFNETQGFDIYGDFHLHVKWICENYFQRDVPFHPELINKGILDIETEIIKGLTIDQATAMAKGRLTAVTIYSSRSDRYYVWRDREDFKGTYFKNDEDYSKIEFRYCETEEDMIMDILYVMNKLEKIDCVTGWNCKKFDIMYLINRLTRLIKEKRLDPHKYSIQYFSPLKSIYINNKGEPTIKGLPILDYMELYFKYVYQKLESYRLDFVAQHELGIKKIEFEGDLTDLYEEDYEKYVFYNFHDVRIVKKMEDKLNFILLHIQISYQAKQNFDDTFSPVRTWESLVYQETRRRDFLLEPASINPAEEYPGAYVKTPVAGFYDDVVAFDYGSLYPFLEMEYEISSETLIEEDELYELFGENQEFLRIMQLKEKVKYTHDSDEYDKIIDMILNREFDLSFLEGTNICLTPSLEFFRKGTNAIMPMYMSKFYHERANYKKKANQWKKDFEGNKLTQDEFSPEMIQAQSEIKRMDLMQLAYKILLNSQYGAFGNRFFRFYDVRLAKSITLGGKLAIKSVMRRVENELKTMYFKVTKKECHSDFIIYGDTDSFYLTLKPLSPFLYKKFNVKSKRDFHARADALNDFAETVVQKIINDECLEVSKYLNTTPKLFMKREAIALRALWLSSKKRYLLSVIDMEGVRYDKPKLKVTGVEIVKSSIPQKIRDGLFSLMETILESEDPYSFESQEHFNEIIFKMKEQFKKLPPEELAFPRSITEIKKWQDDSGNPIKGTPIHVYGAIRFNQYVQKHDDCKLELIKEGEKLRFFYLKSPNKFNTHVISFKTELPEEFYPHLDYRKMIEKTFFDIISLILNEVNLHLNYQRKSADVLGLFQKKKPR